jgi:hypothetical protein
LCDALGACPELRPIYRWLLTQFLEELQLIDQQISQLDQELANLLSRYPGQTKFATPLRDTEPPRRKKAHSQSKTQSKTTGTGT